MAGHTTGGFSVFGLKYVISQGITAERQKQIPISNHNGIPLITHNLGDSEADFLQAVVDALKSRFPGVIVLGGGSAGAVSLVAAVSAEFTGRVQAGKLIQAIAPIVGGKGGGRPDNARGGGKDATHLDAALAKVRTLFEYATISPRPHPENGG